MISGGNIPQFGFTGREPDATGLMYFRARYYDPTMGRFTQRDPIGFAGGLNPYVYVNNSPQNFTDPLGLSQLDVTIAGNGSTAMAGNSSSSSGGSSAPYRFSLFNDSSSGDPFNSASSAPTIVAQAGDYGIEYNRLPITTGTGPFTIPPTGQNLENLRCMAPCLNSNPLVVTGGQEGAGHLGPNHPSNTAVDIAAPGPSGRPTTYNNFTDAQVLECALGCGYTNGWFENSKDDRVDHYHLQTGPDGNVPLLGETLQHINID